MRKIKALLLNFAKKHHWFMESLRKVYYGTKRIGYLFYYVRYKVNKKVIVFESFSGKKYCDSPKAIYLELLKDKRFNNYVFVWTFITPEDHEELANNKNTVIVKYKSKMYYKYYSISGYWFSNSRIPEEIKKKKSQVYIQCWHGTPLKRLGFDIEVSGGNAMNSVKDIKKKYFSEAKKFDYLLSPSKFSSEKFISCFNLKALKKESKVI